MKMKRFFILLLLALALLLAACNGQTNASSGSEYASLSSDYIDFDFKDDAGDTLRSDESGLSGTLAKAESLNFTTGDPAGLSVDLQFCDEYEYTNLSGGEIYVGFLTSEGCASVYGSGIQRVVFHRDLRRLEVFGGNMDYKVFLTTDEADEIRCCLSGTAAQDFTVAVEDGAIVTTGLSGTQSYGFCTLNRPNPVMTEADFPLTLVIPELGDIKAN